MCSDSVLTGGRRTAGVAARCPASSRFLAIRLGASPASGRALGALVGIARRCGARLHGWTGHGGCVFDLDDCPVDPAAVRVRLLGTMRLAGFAVTSGLADSAQAAWAGAARGGAIVGQGQPGGGVLAR
ncbi:MAG: hypothetical protein KGK11_11040 [Sphingomonadales bacterium]|nr:hypothetical protein [Sphingomonadales bacterium]